MAATAGEPVTVYQTRYLRPRECSVDVNRQPKARGPRRSLVSAESRKSASTATHEERPAAQSTNYSMKAIADTVEEAVTTEEAPTIARVLEDNPPTVPTTVDCLIDENDSNNPAGHRKYGGVRRTARKSFSTRTQPARKVAVAKSYLGHMGKNGLVNGLLIKSSELGNKGPTTDATGDSTHLHQRPNIVPDILGTIPVNVADSRSVPFVVLNQVTDGNGQSITKSTLAKCNQQQQQFCENVNSKYGQPRASPSSSSNAATSLRKVELCKTQVDLTVDAELGALLPKLSEMEMVLEGDDSWQTDCSISPEMPVLSPIFDGRESTENYSRLRSTSNKRMLDECDAARCVDSVTGGDWQHSRWKRAKKEVIRPFGSRRMRSWMQRRKCRLSCPDIDVVDGMEFLSFESEQDLERFMRNNPSRVCQITTPPLPSTSSIFPELLAHLLTNQQPPVNMKLFGHPILPTKTSDITRIKGWRNKVFAAGALTKCRLDPDVVRKLSWAQRTCLLNTFTRGELQERGLWDLVSMSCSQYPRREISSSVDPPSTSKTPLDDNDDDAAANDDVHDDTVRPVEEVDNEIYGQNVDEENDCYLLDGFPKKFENLKEEFDRQSIESIDLGIFKTEPFDDDDFIEQPTADIPDPLLSVSPNPAFFQEELTNKSAFVSEYLNNFLKNQSALNVSLTKSMERAVNLDEIQTKVVWPTQEMPAQSEIPSAGFGLRRRRASIGGSRSVSRSVRPRRLSVGGVRGRYNKKFIMKSGCKNKFAVVAAAAPSSSAPHLVEPPSTTSSRPSAIGVRIVTISRATALFATTALVRRSFIDDGEYDDDLLDSPEDIQEALTLPCIPYVNLERIRKRKCQEFSVVMSNDDALRAVTAVVRVANNSEVFGDVQPPTMAASDDGMFNVELPAWKLTTKMSSSSSVISTGLPVTLGSPGVIAAAISACQEEFCRMGCVCDSLKVRRRRRGHCGKVGCMFVCSCDSPFGSADNSEISKNKNDDVDSVCRVKRRREIKIPARLRDSVYFYKYKEDLKVVNVTKAVQARSFKKMMTVSTPLPPPQRLSPLPHISLSMVPKRTNIKDPTAVTTYAKNRPQMYPLAFRRSKIKDDVRRDAILNIRPIKEISCAEAAAYGHLLQSKYLPLHPKKNRVQNRICEDDFKSTLGIRPRLSTSTKVSSGAQRLLFVPEELHRLPTTRPSSSSSSPKEKASKVVADAPSVSAANRPKLIDLQRFKYVDPVVKPAACRSIPAILRRSSGNLSSSSPQKTGSQASSSAACTGTIQRAILKKLACSSSPPPKEPRSGGFQTARKSLNPSIMYRARRVDESRVSNSRMAINRVEIVVKHLVEEIVRKVAFRLEVGDTWQVADQFGRRARMSCFRSSSSSSVVQQLPLRKKLQQHQLSLRTLGTNREPRASKTMSLASHKKSNPPAKSRSPVEESDDDVMCLGPVVNVPGQSPDVCQRALPPPPSQLNSKVQREQQRRNEILSAFTNLAMVSSPVVKDIWSKKDDSVPITAFVFKMACAAILRLQHQEKTLLMIKQGLIRRRMLLFNKYSEFLKDYDPENQKLAIRDLSKKISDCCLDRSKTSSSTNANQPSTASITPLLAIPIASVPNKILIPEVVNVSGKCAQSDEDVEVVDVVVPTPAANVARPVTKSSVVEMVSRFSEGDAIGKVGSKRILVGEPMFLGGIGGLKAAAKAVSASGGSGEEQNQDTMKTIRLQRPFGASQWIPLKRTREASEDGGDTRDSSVETPLMTKIVKLHPSDVFPLIHSKTSVALSNVVKTLSDTLSGGSSECLAASTGSSESSKANNVIKKAAVVSSTAGVKFKGSVPTLFTFSSSSSVPPTTTTTAATKLLLNPLSNVKVIHSKESVTSRPVYTTVSANPFVSAPVSSISPPNFRPNILTSTTKRTTSYANATPSTAAASMMAVPAGNLMTIPILQSLANSGLDCPVTGATFVIGVIPTTAVGSSNGTVSTTTGSKTSTGVLMSPMVNKQQHKQLLTIPLPPGTTSFTLDGQKGVLFMKAAPTATGCLATATSSDQLMEATKNGCNKEASLSSAVAATAAAAQLSQKIVQERCTVQTVSLLLKPVTSDKQQNKSVPHVVKLACVCPLTTISTTTTTTASSNQLRVSQTPLVMPSNVDKNKTNASIDEAITVLQANVDVLSSKVEELTNDDENNVHSPVCPK